MASSSPGDNEEGTDMTPDALMRMVPPAVRALSEVAEERPPAGTAAPKSGGPTINLNAPTPAPPMPTDRVGRWFWLAERVTTNGAPTFRAVGLMTLLICMGLAVLIRGVTALIVILR